MRLDKEFNPVPKIKDKRPKSKKKKLQMYKGVSIPSKRVRGNISKKDYERAVREFGDACAVCGSPYIEMHHILYRSHNGRGKWRNLIPLCPEHHRGKTGVHANYKGMSDKLRNERKRMYGDWYWADKYDLYKANLIPNTTDEAYEKFMLTQEKAHKNPSSIVNQ
ncbi:HNH endonuclease [Salipaludibacillus agaradhaerens]|jgi:5-methylcytosine-specific restriction endonuclease McrA|uniref:HNH endonuclease n=1 Tax=Salipaludibacillus agaradhaerens TaxID=76935 RepID=A0A9Q4B2F2_SALAG|nr:HNH endonuclease signature motif containing protein [Salipaludibacillus agaradhaerens]MCR6096890.1 HNH endonuclease [Salipaludibacillus agaradhaerens]MCR6116734.1 HNH endonuclease [Salipaludibacillus agaradhaerens]